MFPFWLKQTIDTPLFPDIEWERPERRDQAGSLLIIGGSSLGFHAVSEAFQIANDHGVGESHILIPESLKKFTKQLPHVLYGTATHDGFFAGTSFETMLYAAQASDGVLLAGEVGRNSETAIALAQLTRTYTGPLVITKDSFDILYSESLFLAERPNTCIVVAEGQLQRFLKEQRSSIAITSMLDMTQYVTRLHDYTTQKPVQIITKHQETYVLAAGGQIVTTKLDSTEDIWRLKAATRTSVGWLHHRDKPLEGIASAMLQIFD